jgi:flavodoxin
MNTEKIAKVFSRVLNAEIKSALEIKLEELQQYSLVGFGSGIDSGKHYKYLLDLVDRLPEVTNKNAFIFSTHGSPKIATNKEFIFKNHLVLREKLKTKGYRIIDEFSCPGLNTNSFLKLFGGINKGRPNTEDIKHAEEFAEKLKKSFIFSE